MTKQNQFLALSFVIVMILFFPSILDAQNNNISLNALDQQTQAATTTIIKIVKYIALAVMAAGFVWVIYNVVTGKPNTMASIGSLIGGIAIFTIMQIFFP